MKTTNPLTVQKLRAAGHKVSVRHIRSYIVPFQRFILHVPKGSNISRELNIVGKTIKPIQLESKRGETLIEVDLKKGGSYKGHTKCSKKDCYRKKEGVTKSLGRILSAMIKNRVNIDKILEPVKIVKGKNKKNVRAIKSKELVLTAPKAKIKKGSS